MSAFISMKMYNYSGKSLYDHFYNIEVDMIHIVRHGKTDLNGLHVLQGRSDHPLNEEGICQSEQLAVLLGGITFDHVFSSPLKRAIQTAEIIAPYKTALIDERLIEMDYGPYEGADPKDPPVEIVQFFSDFVHNPAPEGMEQLNDVVKRAASFIEGIRSLRGNILISAHAISMKGILEYLTPDSRGSYWSKYIGNCTVYVADNHEGKISVLCELKKENANDRQNKE